MLLSIPAIGAAREDVHASPPPTDLRRAKVAAGLESSCHLLEEGRRALVAAAKKAIGDIPGDGKPLDDNAAAAFTDAVRKNALTGMEAHINGFEGFFKQVFSHLEKTTGLGAGGLEAALQAGGLEAALQAGGLEAALQAGGLEAALQAGGLEAGDAGVIRRLAAIKIKLGPILDTCVKDLENVDIKSTFLFQYLTGNIELQVDIAKNFDPRLDVTYMIVCGWSRKVNTILVPSPSCSISMHPYLQELGKLLMMCLASELGLIEAGWRVIASAFPGRTEDSVRRKANVGAPGRWHRDPRIRTRLRSVSLSVSICTQKLNLQITTISPAHVRTWTRKASARCVGRGPPMLIERDTQSDVACRSLGSC